MFSQNVEEKAMKFQNEVSSLQNEIDFLSKKKKEKEKETYSFYKSAFHDFVKGLNEELRNLGLALESEDLVLFDTTFNPHYEGINFVKSEWKNCLFSVKSYKVHDRVPKLMAQESKIRERAIQMAEKISFRRKQLVELLPQFNKQLQEHPVFGSIDLDVGDVNSPIQLVYQNAQIFINEQYSPETMLDLVIRKYIELISQSAEKERFSFKCPVCGDLMKIVKLHTENSAHGISLQCQNKPHHFGYYADGVKQTFMPGDSYLNKIEVMNQDSWDMLEEIKTKIKNQSSESLV